MHKILDKCPACGGDLVVSEMSCTACDTVIRGTYTGSIFSRLDDENLRFLEIFVACRGNVKQMERETGLGYWTIRGRLDNIIEELGLDVKAVEPMDTKTRRREILEAVEHGELSLTEAERMLVELSSQEK